MMEYREFFGVNMDTTTEATDTVLFKKADLFFALIRIFQLLEDVDPGTLEEDSDDAEHSSLAGLDDEHEGDSGFGDEDDEAPRPFETFLQKHDNAIGEYLSNAASEYIGLFALLSSPLEADPQLKKEFREYAEREHGIDIDFMNIPDKKPRLTIVPTKK